jgi:hypothetical protein
MMHIYPEKLNEIVENYIADKEENVILVYGDCFPSACKLERENIITRTPGLNCCEIIMGRELYRKLRKEGAFFLMPEWAERWEEIFSKHLGLTSENAGYLMKEFHTKLIYLDTGIREIQFDKLEEMSKFVGLPYEVLKIPLSYLRDSILNCNGKAEENGK